MLQVHTTILTRYVYYIHDVFYIPYKHTYRTQYMLSM